MDLITLGISVSTVAIVPLGAVIKKSYRNERRLTVLETNSENVDMKLTEVSAKLDRLIERFL